jgi:hypothetical protein
MSKRQANFDKPTKRAALKRSEGLCEAEGPLYDKPARCNIPLAYGVEFDHYILEANSHDNSLENCRAVCIACHAWKTNNHDKQLAAKTLRQQDKNNGIVKPKQKIQSRGFKHQPSNTKYIEHFE